VLLTLWSLQVGSSLIASLQRKRVSLDSRDRKGKSMSCTSGSSSGQKGSAQLLGAAVRMQQDNQGMAASTVMLNRRAQP
jgi:hypothetical protein